MKTFTTYMENVSMWRNMNHKKLNTDKINGFKGFYLIFYNCVKYQISILENILV